jgi:hypothetical protein
MISAGFYIYESAGLGYAFIPFLVAALLRGDRDKEVVSTFMQKRSRAVAIASYYLFLLIVALLQPKQLSESSGVMLALVVTLPFVGMALWNDVTECNKTGQKSS